MDLVSTRHLPNPYATRGNKNGERGNPWCNPWDGLKKGVVDPFISTNMCVDVIHPMIHLTILKKKPICKSIRCKNVQETGRKPSRDLV